jgi:hypothetical protein
MRGIVVFVARFALAGCLQGDFGRPCGTRVPILRRSQGYCRASLRDGVQEQNGKDGKDGKDGKNGVGQVEGTKAPSPLRFACALYTPPVLRYSLTFLGAFFYCFRWDSSYFTPLGF